MFKITNRRSPSEKPRVDSLEVGATFKCYHSLYRVMKKDEVKMPKHIRTYCFGENGISYLLPETLVEPIDVEVIYG